MADIALGPWFRGEDTRHAADPRHPAYQAGQDDGPFLLGSVNCVIDESGSAVRRPGLTDWITLTAGKRLFGGSSLLLAQDGTDLLLVDQAAGTTSVLASDLSADTPAHFHELAGNIFVTDGSVFYVVDSTGTLANWGQDVPPPPTLTTIVGNLPAGRYRACCVTVDANGVHSGASKATAITVNGNEDLRVNLASVDANADKVDVYVGLTNQPEMYMVKRVDPGALPTTVDDMNVSSRILMTQFLSPPSHKTGWAGIGSWRGSLLLWQGQRVIRSKGNAHHLFDFRNNVWKFPHTVKAAAGTKGVCWIATSEGMYLQTGDPVTGEVEREPVHDARYASGFAMLDGAKLGVSRGLVPAFASEDGLTLGLPDGELLRPQEGSVRWDVEGKSADICYAETGAMKNVYVTLE